MKRSTRFYRQAARAAPGLMVAVLVTWLAGAAWAQPEMAPPRPGLELEDAELAAITRDIILLRMINQVGMSPDQIEALIPVLEGLLADEQALCREVKAIMLEQRRALLKGDVPEAQLEATRQKIKQRTKQFRDDTSKRLKPLGERLTAEQNRRLRGLVMGGPGLWRHGMREPGPGPARIPQARRGAKHTEQRPDAEMGPSARVLGRVIALLKEKLEVMRG